LIFILIKTKSGRMQLSTKNIKASTKYIKRLKQLSARAKLTITAEELTKKLRKEETNEEERDQSITKIKSLKTAFVHYMTGSLREHMHTTTSEQPMVVTQTLNPWKNTKILEPKTRRSTRK
jgi:hypothetical protein